MSLLDDVKARIDIVDVVGHYVPLRQAGRLHKAPCPFHSERTPSFVVDPSRGTWRCFGACAEGGDAIRFVMKMENQSFSEALHTLAVRLGVPIPTPGQRARVDPLLRANAEALQYFQRRLHGPEGEAALAYLQERGVTSETAAAFGIGLSPEGADTLKAHMAAQGYTEEELLRAGLLTRGDGGPARDLFRGRLMFPIRTRMGDTAGFGGRALDGRQPKYLNTPQTHVFNKASLLYGLDAAWETIRLQGEGVVVEGYMDALMAHQHGYTNVVAAMGTALTAAQVASLREFAGSFVLALDPDAAGQEATLRSLKAAWAPVRSVRIALLPGGRDPDALIREAPERWPEVLASAEPRLDFAFRVLPQRYALDTAEGKHGLTEELGGWIEQEPAETQDRYLERLEKLLGVTRQTLMNVLQVNARRLRAGRDAGSRRAAAPLRDDSVQIAASAFADGAQRENSLLSILLRNPDFHAKAAELRPELFQHSENREIFRHWSQCAILDDVQDTLDPILQERFTSLVDDPHPSLETMDHKQRSLSMEQMHALLERAYVDEQITMLSTALGDAEEAGQDTAAIESQLREHTTRRREIDLAASPRREA